MAGGHDILIVADDLRIIKALTRELSREGLIVDVPAIMKDIVASAALKGSDLVVIKSDSGGISSLDVCRRLKSDARTSHVPVIIISSKRDEVDAVLSLEIGADDYVTEPLNFRELSARIKAVLRRTLTPKIQEKVLKIGEITIDTEKCKVWRSGERLEMTAQAYRLLCFLAERRGKVFSREQLRDAVWQKSPHVGLRTIDVHMRKLRQQLERSPSSPEYLKTMRGIGYFIEHDRAPSSD
jgi:two-component system, OmpR family, alkaline phosphatase synthesis response regulator PhoP